MFLLRVDPIEPNAALQSTGTTYYWNLLMEKLQWNNTQGQSSYFQTWDLNPSRLRSLRSSCQNMTPVILGCWLW